jgi:hypothetical protein
VIQKEDAMSDDEKFRNQSGGVNISGGQVTVGGDVVGGDKIINSHAQIDELFQPVADAVRAAAPERQQEATQKVETLKSEVAKGKGADDGLMAKLVDGIVGLVPAAVSAIAGAFASPILGGVAGPVTKFVLDKLQGK